MRLPHKVITKLSDVTENFDKLRNVFESVGSLTASDSSTVDAVYGPEEAAVLENLRTRVDELEVIVMGLKND